MSDLPARKPMSKRRAGKRGGLCLYIDARALMIKSTRLTTKQVGAEMLALMRGDPSVLESVVVRRRQYAPARPRDVAGWQRIRAQVFARDGHACVYCGSRDRLECDHVRPIAKGGGHDMANLATACRSCNSSKRDRDVDEWLASRLGAHL